MNPKRKTIIAGNWKMNKTALEAIDLANGLNRELGDLTEIDIVICPAFSSLSDVQEILTDSNIRLGAQNLHWENAGAFTGEVSAPMLKSVGVEYVIIGHSERRQFFGETNASVNKKIKAALKNGLAPILCVGENLHERETNQTFAVVKNHCEGSLSDLTPAEMELITLAYEPVWAIGTGKTATPAQAQEVQAFVRDWLSQQSGSDLAEKIRIQYGGSVTPENIADLMAQPDIDGALVGGASLKVESFVKIVKQCCLPFDKARMV